MSRDHGKVYLVGSVGRLFDNWSVEKVYRTCGKHVGGLASMLPDGEVGDRVQWIQFLPYRVYSDHPDMKTLSRHTKQNPWNHKYADHWLLTIKPGVKELHFPTLHYADEAINSYKVFAKMRDEGVIAKNTRFQFGLPMTESGVRAFIDSPEHMEILWHAYEEAMARDVKKIVDTIPHKDLALVWDICVEVASVEGILQGMGSWKDEYKTLPNDPLKRYQASIEKLTRGKIPNDVWLGFHICYGSLEHEDGRETGEAHFCEIENLDVSVRMANAGAEAIGRPVDFIHLSVPKSKGLMDDYYRPLTKLDIGDGRVYLGLLHLSDGVDGTVGRVKVARKFLENFGIATECGWGRRPATQKIEDILQLHRDVAAKMVA